MRVITGSARGKKLKTLEGLDVRPTSEKVKEAVFSAIQFDIPGAFVLDLFAGSGQLGVEALSRGASGCVFIDNSTASLNIVKENAVSAGVSDKSKFLCTDAVQYLRTAKGGFDIAFLDPPYRKGLISEALAYLDIKMNDGGIAVCEHESETTLPDSIGSFTVLKRYKYGSVSVTTYIKNSDSEE